MTASTRTLLTLCAAALFALGCAGQPADRSQRYAGASASPDVTPLQEVPVYGFVIEVEIARTVLQGELIAVDGGYLYLLTSPETLRAIRLDRMYDVDIELFESSGAVTGLAVWTVVGSISTVSHGGWAVISLPIWLLAGSAVTVSEARRNDVDFELPTDLPLLYQYARFPQGLPESWRPRAVLP